jgi:hypothetical protein
MIMCRRPFLKKLGDDVTVFLLLGYFHYQLVRPSTDYNYGHERFSLLKGEWI